MRAFLETHAPLLLRLARGHASDGAQAEDVAQEVAAALLRQHRDGSFDPDTLEVPEAYLRVAVRNASSRARRRRALIEQLTAEGDLDRVSDEATRLDTAASVTPEELTRDAIDKRRWLDTLKARLRPRDAVAFAMLVEDQMGIDEVAKALGTTANNVYQMRHRILAVANEMLDKDSDSTRLSKGEGAS